MAQGQDIGARQPPAPGRAQQIALYLLIAALPVGSLDLFTGIAVIAALCALAVTAERVNRCLRTRFPAPRRVS